MVTLIILKQICSKVSRSPSPKQYHSNRRILNTHISEEYSSRPAFMFPAVRELNTWTIHLIQDAIYGSNLATEFQHFVSYVTFGSNKGENVRFVREYYKIQTSHNMTCASGMLIPFLFFLQCHKMWKYGACIIFVSDEHLYLKVVKYRRKYKQW